MGNRTRPQGYAAFRGIKVDNQNLGGRKGSRWHRVHARSRNAGIIGETDLQSMLAMRCLQSVIRRRHRRADSMAMRGGDRPARRQRQDSTVAGERSRGQRTGATCSVATWRAPQHSFDVQSDTGFPWWLNSADECPIGRQRLI